MSWTWLCPTDQDRARLIENSARVARARRVASTAVALMMLYFAPVTGWWTLGLLALSAVNLETQELRMRRSRKPEYHAALSVVWSQVVAGVAAALTGGPHSPALALVAIPTAFAATRFSPRVVWAATAVAIVVVLGASFGVHFSDSLANPAGPIVAVALVVGISAAAQAMNGAELDLRDAAILDPLTGLLNRHGLERRVDELAEQARLSNAPISLLVCDLDHFKQVNDTYGHAVGDAVLRDIAYELRKQLRSFELIYRIGGEEFLVVLPGAEPAEARALADRLCEAVRRCRTQDLALTMSAGISTRWGADTQFAPLFDAADRALYAAKAAGRDRVCVGTVLSALDGPAGIRLVTSRSEAVEQSGAEAPAEAKA